MGKDPTHLFLNCPFVADCWANLFNTFNLHWVFPSNASEAFVQLILGTSSKGQANNLWFNAIVGLLWKVWPKRNKRTFHEDETDRAIFWDLVKKLYLLGLNLFETME